MDQWSGLDFFQVDNLIRGRVAFHIVNLGVSFEEIYPVSRHPMEAIHIRNRELKLGAALEAAQVIAAIEQEKIAVQEPIVVFCEDGKLSARVTELLQAKGFKNAYFAKGGVDSLKLQMNSGMA